MRVLVLGASGMLGNAVLRAMHEKQNLEVFGAVRSSNVPRSFSEAIAKKIITGCDVSEHDALVKLFAKVRPDVVVNCIGLIKQLADVDDLLITLPINAMLPHRLSNLCALVGARLVHMSTDCVFSGTKGNYIEGDISDATDLYGKSKFLGEVDYPHAITLRTSIIGHALQSEHGLIDWFLSQQDCCKGYKRTIFSGLPTVALAQIIRDVVIPRPDLSGVYHVAAEPISKYDLLRLVADVYGKTIEIVPDDQLVIDRSLNADRFKQVTGYVAPAWPDLIKLMHSYQ
ncbi:MAG: SDR family oxidoreductase [Methylotenera sp.]|nr:SDR family oxidoreductase [Methylotenera sp.]MDD4925336.1 SDR family oxidoreductase [Methylotenera sp.]